MHGGRMTLVRLEEYDPNYRKYLGTDIHNFEAYTEANERIGRVVDAWVDNTGRIQHLVVSVEHLGGSKHAMLPFSNSQLDRPNKRMVMSGLSHTELDNIMPTRSPQQQVTRMAALEESAPLEGYTIRAIAPYPASTTVANSAANSIADSAADSVPGSSASNPEAALVSPPTLSRGDRPSTRVNESNVVDENTIPLREERITVATHKRKVGEVIVRKEVETQMIQVPVRREKLIVERIDGGTRQIAEIYLNDDEPPKLL